MDDIDDILASVDRDTLSVPQAAALDHQILTRFWVAERGAPELLPWPEKLMERVMGRVGKQISIIEDLSLSADPSSSPNLNLKLCIIQSDLARTQYLVRSLLRQRIAKLTKHSLHYLRLSAPEYSPSSQSQSQSQTQSSQSQSRSQSQSQYQQQQQQQQGSSSRTNTLLSAQEVAFLRSHQSLLSTHYTSSFLSHFPPALRRLDDSTGGTSPMVTAPETKEVVVVRCLAEMVRIVVPADIPPAGTGSVTASGWARQEVLGHGAAMRKGEVWIVRWEGVRDAWENGEVEVL